MGGREERLKREFEDRVTGRSDDQTNIPQDKIAKEIQGITAAIGKMFIYEGVNSIKYGKNNTASIEYNKENDNLKITVMVKNEYYIIEKNGDKFTLYGFKKTKDKTVRPIEIGLEKVLNELNSSIKIAEAVIPVKEQEKESLSKISWPLLIFFEEGGNFIGQDANGFVVNTDTSPEQIEHTALRLISKEIRFKYGPSEKHINQLQGSVLNAYRIGSLTTGMASPEVEDIIKDTNIMAILSELEKVRNLDAESTKKIIRQYKEFSIKSEVIYLGIQNLGKTKERKEELADKLETYIKKRKLKMPESIRDELVERIKKLDPTNGTNPANMSRIIEILATNERLYNKAFSILVGQRMPEYEQRIKDLGYFKKLETEIIANQTQKDKPLSTNILATLVPEENDLDPAIVKKLAKIDPEDVEKYLEKLLKKDPIQFYELMRAILPEEIWLNRIPNLT